MNQALLPPHQYGGGGSGGGGGAGSFNECASQDIQKELNVLMNILEENAGKMTEGEYLQGMNALGALHKHNRVSNPGEELRRWMTLDEIEATDEDLYDEIMGVADDIVVELCGENTSIFTRNEFNMLHRGQEHDVFHQLLDYKPEVGNAGYDTSPMILHHAIQVIMARVFDDTHYELEIVRPVSCQCGWRGPQGNWDRHVSNMRHQRWAVSELERKSAEALEDARKRIVARREPGIVYIDELHSTPETRRAMEEAVVAAEAAGDRIVFTNALGERSWFY